LGFRRQCSPSSAEYESERTREAGSEQKERTEQKRHPDWQMVQAVGHTEEYTHVIGLAKGPLEVNCVKLVHCEASRLRPAPSASCLRPVVGTTP